MLTRANPIGMEHIVTTDFSPLVEQLGSTTRAKGREKSMILTRANQDGLGYPANYFPPCLPFRYPVCLSDEGGITYSNSQKKTNKIKMNNIQFVFPTKEESHTAIHKNNVIPPASERQKNQQKIGFTL